MENSLRARVVDAEERLRQAMLHSDVHVLDELVAPELLFTSHTGQLVSKADDLAFHQARVLRLEELEPSEQRIQIHAGFAVASVLMHLVGAYDGAPTDQHIRYTRIWSISPDGALRVVAGHMSEVQTG
jgi:hypothetical protein